MAEETMEQGTQEVAPEGVAPEQTSEETSEAQAPDVGEALNQMNQRFDSLEQRLPAPEEPADPLAALTAPLSEEEWNGAPDGDQQQQGQQGQEQYQPEGGDDAAELRGLLNEAAQEAVMPWIMQQETNQRTQAIQSFAAEHPNFTGEAVDAVSQRLIETGQMPQNGLPPDPRAVEDAYLAYEARAAAQASQEGTAEADSQGATLETGAGPGAPDQTVDPVAEQYMRAIQGPQNRDAFSQ